MTYIAKPRLHHPTLHTNKVGYTRRDYEGRISTLCAGCGHDSISAAIIVSASPRRILIAFWTPVTPARESASSTGGGDACMSATRSGRTGIQGT